MAFGQRRLAHGAAEMSRQRLLSFDQLQAQAADFLLIAQMLGVPVLGLLLQLHFAL